MMRRIKKGSAILLAAALVFSALALPKAYAAGRVEMRTDCSIQVNCTIQKDTAWNNLTTEAGTYLPELETNEVQVKLYKVASIGENARYTALSDFSALDLSDTKINSSTSAATWQELAELAKGVVVKKNLQAEDKHISSTGEEGICTFNNLETGLYLVLASKESTNRYRYEFAPYLISLPSNNYYQIEKNATEGNPPQEIPANADDWIYNLTGDNAIGLKPERFPRFGYLKIEKEVEKANATIPGEVFVYEITATLPGETKPVFNDVVTIDFNEQPYVFVGPIVADSNVTVNEVYTGASYIQDSVTAYDKDGNAITLGEAVIQAEDIFNNCNTLEDAEAKLANMSLNDISKEIIFKYKNKGNDTLNGGTGVTNTITNNMIQNYEGQSAPTWNQPQE